MKTIANILLLMLFVFIASSNSQQNSEWLRIESENKEVSFAMPKDFSYSFDKEGFTQVNPQNWKDTADYKNIRSITAYQNGVTMFFESYDTKNSKKSLPYFLYNHLESQYRNISFENFSGLQITSEKSSYIVFYYLASDKNTYLIGFGAREKTNETISKFLKTIKLNGKFLFEAAQKANESDKVLSLANLRETPIEVVYNLENKKEKKKKSDQIKTMETKLDVAKELVVLFKPRPTYTERARQESAQGVVRLKVALSANGQIGQITVVKDLGYGLTENTIKVLKRLRFIPAEKDNFPVTVVKTIEYSFSIY